MVPLGYHACEDDSNDKIKDVFDCILLMKFFNCDHPRLMILAAKLISHISTLCPEPLLDPKGWKI
jgi:hypothetical protein